MHLEDSLNKQHEKKKTQIDTGKKIKNKKKKLNH